MSCEKCGKPYMAGLEFRYTNSGDFLCLKCYDELYPDGEVVEQDQF